MTTAAQDEFNNLIRDKDHETRHPEDRLDDSDLSEPESPGAADDYLEKVDTDDELDLPANMRANYYMPSLRSEANTGPKGVIADAQAYEQAKKQAKRFTFRRNPSPAQYEVKVWHDDKALSDEDSDDSFMKEWRAKRLRELQNAGQRIRSRTTSPSRRIYGKMVSVDAVECDKIVQNIPRDTTVVVFIYQELTPFDDVTLRIKQESLERCMHEVARRNDTVRFVAMSGEDIVSETEKLPAIYAYRNRKDPNDWNSVEDTTAGWNSVLDDFTDNDITAVSVENGLRKNSILLT